MGMFNKGRIINTIDTGEYKIVYKEYGDYFEVELIQNEVLIYSSVGSTFLEVSKHVRDYWRKHELFK